MRENSDYNDEPVYYCGHCLSLRVLHLPYIHNSEYCDACGSTNILSSHIEDWENKYLNKYKFKFLEDKNGRKSGQ